MQRIEMYFYCFADEFERLFLGLADGHTSRKIWNVSSNACGPVFYNNHVAHMSNL